MRTAVTVLVGVGIVVVTIWLAGIIGDLVAGLLSVGGMLLTAGVEAAHQVRANREQTFYEAKVRHYSKLLHGLATLAEDGSRQDAKVLHMQAQLVASEPVVDEVQNFLSLGYEDQSLEKLNPVIEEMKNELQVQRSKITGA